MSKIEFRQHDTKAALHLIHEMEEKSRQRKEAAMDMEQRGETEGKEWIVASWFMEAEILQNAVEKLKREIETQNFDY